MNKQSKLEILKYYRNTGEIQPLEYNEVKLDFDETSQRRLHNAYDAMNGTDETIVWTTSDDGIVELNAEMIKEIFVLAMQRANELHDKYRTLRDKVNTAETEEEINAVNW